MAIKKKELHLLNISKCLKSELDNFKRGVYYEKHFSLEIHEIQKIVCLDRMHYAQQILKTAKKISKLKNTNRSTLSRSYYSMYHAARAVVYFNHGGDDNEAHSSLPKNLPSDFPNRVNWQNELNTARLNRNRADYDPYPADKVFNTETSALLILAEQFLTEAKSYLKRKGLTI